MKITPSLAAQQDIAKQNTPHTSKEAAVPTEQPQL